MNCLAVFRGRWVWVLNTHPDSNSRFVICRSLEYLFGGLQHSIVAGREELQS